jgi:hypothetical protein
MLGNANGQRLVRHTHQTSDWDITHAFFSHVLAILLLSSACSSVELASPDADSSAKRFSAETGKSVVYVVFLGGYGRPIFV